VTHASCPSHIFLSTSRKGGEAMGANKCSGATQRTYLGVRHEEGKRQDDILSEDQQKCEAQSWGRLTGNNPRTGIQGRGAVKTVRAIAHSASCSAPCARSRTVYLKKSMSRTKVETQNTHLEANEAVRPHCQHTPVIRGWTGSFLQGESDSSTFRGHIGRRGLDDRDTDCVV
jgi:hypothetical protein